jgi:N-acetylglucosamine-6-phosphate deacetylase
MHGAAGVDIMQGGDAGATVARATRHGTTAMLGTTMTATDNSIRRALQAGRRHRRTPAGARACWACIWKARSQHPPPARSRPTWQAAWRWCAASRHRADRAMTLAPEIPGHLELIPQLAAMGIRVQLGHSNGTMTTAWRRCKAGASGFTHLFNGMTG